MQSPQWETTMEQIALNNPIILTKILQQACTPLKSCRLVSHFWNDIVLSLPNTRFALQLARKNHLADENPFQDDYDLEDVDPDPAPFLDLCSTLDERFARRICATCPSSSDPKNNSFVSKLLHVCDKFSHFIQILEISIRSEVSLPLIYQILNNCCPALTQLRINVSSTNSSGDNHSQMLFHQPLQPKRNLAIFTDSAPLNVDIQFLTQLVVNAAPNLRQVTLPLGFCPDFHTSKRLDTLLIGQDNFLPTENVDRSVVSKLLAQVGDQLVTLRLGHAEMKAIDGLEFDLGGRKMTKLRNFRNRMVDIFRSDDLFKNIAGLMPSLTTVQIGGGFTESKRVDEMLQDFANSKQIVGSVTNLVLIGVYDPNNLDGLETVFPNVARLQVDSLYGTKLHWWVTYTELSFVLPACGGWMALRHLNLGVSSYPRDVVDVLRDLWANKDLYKGKLKTFEIKRIKCIYHYPGSHDLTTEELNLFKKLLMEMNGMDEITISFLYFGEKSRRKILDFMVSNKMEVSKFKMFQGGKTCLVGD